MTPDPKDLYRAMMVMYADIDVLNELVQGERDLDADSLRKHIALLYEKATHLMQEGGDKVAADRYMAFVMLGLAPPIEAVFGNPEGKPEMLGSIDLKEGD